MYVRTGAKGTMFLSGIPEILDREEKRRHKIAFTEENKNQALVWLLRSFCYLLSFFPFWPQEGVNV